MDRRIRRRLLNIADRGCSVAVKEIAKTYNPSHPRMMNVHCTEGGWPIHMNHQTLVPEPFGPLSSLKIVSKGILIAQPYAAALYPEMGAEVIQLQRHPGLGDVAW